MKIYTCSCCRYTFERERRPETCPDCGSDAVRNATAAEEKEYWGYQWEFYPERFRLPAVG